MTVIVTFSLPASQFVLGKALQEAPTLEVELEQMIPTGVATIPYFWVSGDDREPFDAVLAREPELASFEVIDELDGRWLYRAEWEPSIDTFVQAIVTHEAVLQKAGGDDDSWEFQLRFTDSHQLSEFHTACKDAGIDVDIEALYNPVQPTHRVDRSMTDSQRRLVEHAYDEGYFKVPRRITLVELGEQLGISDQAVNERLRRGLQALIASTLKSDADDE